MTLIISLMLLYGLFPDINDVAKLGLTLFLFIVWVIRCNVKGEK